MPKRIREGINVSDVHPLADASALIIGLTAIAVVIALALIFLIEVALYFVPTETEARLFSSWLPEDLTAISPVDDRLYETQLLVERLTAHWAEAPFEFRVEIEDTDDANAMALPGGLIIVTRGLLDDVGSENELAFVLGHELGHYRNRDHLRALGRGVVMALFFRVVTGNDIAGIGINVADITVRSFSRKQESRADEFGLALVNAEYGHVEEAWRLFQRWDGNGEATADAIPYLSTHPRPGDRVSHMQELADREGWSRQGAVTGLKW
ncbi:MAG: M48 family metallopeptidase [Gammaproteobacteria bacterium]|nr:M48 family metallopeptidase [Gammaproteobacteria bacterium]